MDLGEGRSSEPMCACRDRKPAQSAGLCAPTGIAIPIAPLQSARWRRSCEGSQKPTRRPIRASSFVAVGPKPVRTWPGSRPFLMLLRGRRDRNLEPVGIGQSEVAHAPWLVARLLVKLAAAGFDPLREGVDVLRCRAVQPDALSLLPVAALFPC